ncbi:MAG: GAF domain-containing protein [Chloroflexi bacterium]|nr:MAG: GAF domain-containing protein [Chloroflexota bacterium]
MNLDCQEPLTAAIPIAVASTLATRIDIGDSLSARISLPLVVAAVAGMLMVATALLCMNLWRRLERSRRLAQRHNEQLHALHEASLSLTAELSQEAVLQKVVDLSRRLVDARYGALGIVDKAGHIQALITSGLSEEEYSRMGPLPQGRGLLGAVLHEGRPIRVADIQKDARSVGFPPNHPPMKSFLGVPVIFKGQTVGNLYLTDKQGAGEFSAEDEELLTMFATQAAIAIENARLYQQVQALAVATERERIAREMHDGLAQVLSYVNAKSQAVREFLQAGQVEPALVQLQQLEEAAREVYADVREAILGLRTTIGKGRGLFTVLEEYLQRFSEQTGIQTELRVLPEANAFAFDPRAEIQIMRIVQEALTNVRKHARANRAWVCFVANGAWSEVTVEDDGRGFDLNHPRRDAWPCFGLQTMRERAEAVGGSLRVESRPGEGTRVIARIPLSNLDLSHPIG